MDADLTTRDEIRTDRLLLRAPQPSDAGAMALYCADRRLAEMTTSIPHPYLPAMAETFIEQVRSGRHRETVWVMDGTPSDAAELIGIIALKRDAAEIGYWVGPPFWSTGYASEAVAALCDHLEATRGMREIHASVFADNPASAQVLRKAGFEEAGETRLHSIARGAEVPALRFLRRAA